MLGRKYVRRGVGGAGRGRKEVKLVVDCETETGGLVIAITRCGNVRHPF